METKIVKRFAFILPGLYLLIVLVWFVQDKLGQIFSWQLPWNICHGDSWFQFCVTPAVSVVILLSFPGIIVWAWVSFFLAMLFPRIITDNVISSFVPMAICTAGFYLALEKIIESVVRKIRLQRKGGGD